MIDLKTSFKKLTAHHHFLVFLIILTVLKIANVFLTEGAEAGLHFSGLGVGLIVISSVLHLFFSRLFDKKKKYLHSLISTFLIILMLSHADPEPIRGVLVILLLYVSKFFIKYNGQNIFNPVIFTIGVITLLSMFIPFLGVPPMDFTGIDIRFLIFGKELPLSILPIILALVFNVNRVKKHPLAVSYIVISLLPGFFLIENQNEWISYLIITLFIGTAVIIEPKTSPFKPKEQIIYGTIMAIFLAFLTFLDVANPLAIGLLLGNLGYFFYKKYA